MDVEDSIARIAAVVEFASMVFRRITANRVEVAVFVSMGENDGFVEYAVVSVFVSIITRFEFVEDAEMIFAKIIVLIQHVIRSVIVLSANKRVLSVQNNPRYGLIWMIIRSLIMS